MIAGTVKYAFRFEDICFLSARFPLSGGFYLIFLSVCIYQPTREDFLLPLQKPHIFVLDLGHLGLDSI